jgi:hypothetical protein
MVRSRNLTMFAVSIAIAFVGLYRFSPGVRTVNVLGLFASGMAFGAALRGIVMTMRAGTGS